MTCVPFVLSRSMMKGLPLSVPFKHTPRGAHLTEVVASPYSFFSVICLNWITACCFEHDGCAIGMSVTC